jgi:hypothetical protein
MRRVVRATASYLGPGSRCSWCTCGPGDSQYQNRSDSAAPRLRPFAAGCRYTSMKCAASTVSPGIAMPSAPLTQVKMRVRSPTTARGSQ